jgi:enoyl-CoA hydratase/carnithine racemase
VSLVLTADGAPGLRLITLNKPQRKNGLGPLIIGELQRAFAAAFEDASVKVIVLGGAGDAFSVGADFQEMQNAGADGALPGDYVELMLAMTSAPKPIVAKVHGHALGGGLGLVAASHFAIGARGIKLGTPEVDVGLFPMMIMAVLQRLVNKRRLLEMMLFGEKFDADEAARIGILNRAVDPAELDGAVETVTSRLLEKSPAAIRLGLTAFAKQDDLELEAALPLLRDALAGCLGTDDAREGLRAFLEKRKPNWTGK